MAIETAALMLAPTGLRIASNILGKGGKPSEYEEQLFRMADIFGSAASVPLTETRAFKSGMSILDEKDDENRRAINNASAVSGSTDEARLANMQDSNENLNRGINRLLEFAKRAKDRNQRLQLSYLGAGERARQNRLNQRQKQFGAVLDPLGEAAGSFAMADLFGPGTGDLKKASDTITSILNTPGGSTVFGI